MGKFRRLKEDVLICSISILTFGIPITFIGWRISEDLHPYTYSDNRDNVHHHLTTFGWD